MPDVMTFVKIMSVGNTTCLATVSLPCECFANDATGCYEYYLFCFVAAFILLCFILFYTCGWLE